MNAAKEIPVGFFLHQNSLSQFELWKELSDTLAREGTPSYTYFLFESVLLLELLPEVPVPGKHLTACSLAIREQAVAVADSVMPAGLPSLSQTIAHCRPFFHLSSHYQNQISTCLDDTTPQGDSQQLHVALAESTHTHSTLAEALRLAYGLHVQSDHRLTLSLNSGQSTVLREDPITAQRYRELEEAGRILSNPPDNTPRIIF